MRDREQGDAARRERNNPDHRPSRERINLSVSRAAETGGIPGYFGERSLLLLKS